MDTMTPNQPEENARPVEARRFLDPFEEWRDHANRWDLADLTENQSAKGQTNSSARLQVPTTRVER